MVELEKIVIDYKAEPEIYFKKNVEEIKSSIVIEFLDERDFTIKWGDFEVWRNLD